MTTPLISTGFKEISYEDALAYTPGLAGAWKDPTIPQLQYDIAVKPELESYRRGAPCAPFSAFIKTLLELPPEMDKPETTMLDVGAASGYYSEVLKIAGFKYTYEASDYSEHFQKLAAQLYPNLKFHLADARELPMADNSYDIVVSGCVMIHVLDYEAIVKETARVTKKCAIFHRTPVNISDRPTRYFLKEAYGIPCLEYHYREGDLMKLFLKNGLFMKTIHTVFEDPRGDYAQREYLLEKR